MDQDELGRLWRLDSETRPIDEEAAMRIARWAEQMDRAVLRRDVSEILAGLLVVAAAWATSLAAPGWPPKMGAAALTTGVLYPLARLVGARRRDRRQAGERPVVAQLRSELHRIDAEISLLRSVRSWYVAPLSAGGLFWAMTVVAAAPVEPGLVWASLAITGLGGGAVCLAVGWGVERVNRRAAEKLEPYRAEVGALLGELEAT